MAGRGQWRESINCGFVAKEIWPQTFTPAALVPRPPPPTSTPPPAPYSPPQRPLHKHPLPPSYFTAPLHPLPLFSPTSVAPVSLHGVHSPDDAHSTLVHRGAARLSDESLIFACALGILGIIVLLCTFPSNRRAAQSSLAFAWLYRIKYMELNRSGNQAVARALARDASHRVHHELARLPEHD